MWLGCRQRRHPHQHTLVDVPALTPPRATVAPLAIWPATQRQAAGAEKGSQGVASHFDDATPARETRGTLHITGAPDCRALAARPRGVPSSHIPSSPASPAPPCPSAPRPQKPPRPSRPPRHPQSPLLLPFVPPSLRLPTLLPDPIRPRCRQPHLLPSYNPPPRGSAPPNIILQLRKTPHGPNPWPAQHLRPFPKSPHFWLELAHFCGISPPSNRRKTLDRD